SHDVVRCGGTWESLIERADVLDREQLLAAGEAIVGVLGQEVLQPAPRNAQLGRRLLDREELGWVSHAVLPCPAPRWSARATNKAAGFRPRPPCPFGSGSSAGLPYGAQERARTT